jgi:hypothetical protein
MTQKFSFWRITTALLLCVLAAPSFAVGEPPWDAEASPGLAALTSASQEGQYTLLMFWRDNDDATQRMLQVLQTAAPNQARQAGVLQVRVNDPAESATVKVFGVDRAPMPLAVAVAPNGAITKAWPLQVSESQIAEGMVSEGTAACLKALQERKLVVLCVQQGKSTPADAVWQGAQDFKTDSRFAATTELVTLDATDAGESAFLQALKVSPHSADTVTVLLAPPGRPFAQFVGTVSKEQIVAKVTAAQTGCCPGGKCGPGGCCPDGKCAPGQCCPDGNCGPAK